MLDNLKMTKDTDKVLSHCLMEKNIMLGNGKMAKDTDKVLTRILMEENPLDNLKMMK